MKKGLIINEDKWALIEELEPEEQSLLLFALAAYHRGAEVPQMDRIVRMVFSQICQDNAKFDPQNMRSLSEVRSEAGKKGAEQKWQTMAKMANDGKDGKTAQEKKRKEEDKKREDIESGKRMRFVPPTVEEVKAYAREKQLDVDAERFVAFYESKGWMVGKNKMQNWRAAMSGWGARDKKEHPPNREDDFAVDLSEIDYTRLLRKEASG